MKTLEFRTQGINSLSASSKEWKPRQLGDSRGGSPLPSRRMQSWQPLLDRGQCGKGGVGFGLVPVGDRVIIVGAVVGVAVIDGGAQRLGKRDRRVEMEAVDRPAGPGALRSHD